MQELGHETAVQLAEEERLKWDIYASQSSSDLVLNSIVLPRQESPIKCTQVSPRWESVSSVSPLRVSPPHALQVDPVGGWYATPSSQSSLSTSPQTPVLSVQRGVGYTPSPGATPDTNVTSSIVFYAPTLSPDESHFVSTQGHFSGNWATSHHQPLPPPPATTTTTTTPHTPLTIFGCGSKRMLLQSGPDSPTTSCLWVTYQCSYIYTSHGMPIEQFL